MIVLNVTYKCKPGMRDAFLERLKAEGISETTHAEEGNIKYDYYIPADGCNELLLIEKWRDKDVLAKHATLPHFARLMGFKSEYVADTVIEKFFVE